MRDEAKGEEKDDTDADALYMHRHRSATMSMPATINGMIVLFLLLPFLDPSSFFPLSLLGMHNGGRRISNTE